MIKGYGFKAIALYHCNIERVYSYFFFNPL